MINSCAKVLMLSLSSSLVRELEAFLENPWVIGVSGGIDSMVLYDSIKKTFPLKSLHIVHVNHQISPVAAQWENFVHNQSQKRGDLFYSRRVLCDPPSEAIARTKRYEVFKEILGTLPKSILILGHHQDDQMETILWRFLRGAPLQGLMGMSHQITYQKNFTIVRPLLSLRKKEIALYAEQHQLPYCTDPSNSNPIYTRNHLRLHIIPLLPEPSDTLLKTHQMLRYNYEALEAFVQPWIDNPLWIKVDEHPHKSLSSLWTLLSLWIAKWELPHPSEAALRAFCQDLLQGHQARLSLDSQWILLYEHRTVYKVAAIYFTDYPQKIEIDLQKCPQADLEGQWGIFEWRIERTALISGKILIRRLDQKEKISLHGKKLSAATLWKQMGLFWWERPFYPAFFDEHGTLIGYPEYDGLVQMKKISPNLN